jgi:hypothetical protein
MSRGFWFLPPVQVFPGGVEECKEEEWPYHEVEFRLTRCRNKHFPHCLFFER